MIPLFERLAPPRVVRGYQRLAMPLFLPLCGFVPSYCIVEAIGRRSGLPRRVPVGGRRFKDGFWIVAGIGTGTYYVRNLQANPRVRVKFSGRWHDGTAQLRPDDDAGKRMFRINAVNGLFLWIAGGEHLSVRIDLDR